MRRRQFLTGLNALACSAAAHPFFNTLTFAKAGPHLGDQRLVVVILRGAMDGLDVVKPVGDPNFARLRPKLSAQDHLDLNGYFALHSGLADLMPLWNAGELSFVHATSTPYRDKRSHFDGQDILEAGTGFDVAAGARRDGWLNRMLQSLPSVESETAYAVGRDEMKLLIGPTPYRRWTPDQSLTLSSQGRLLWDHISHEDEMFRDAVGQALILTEEADNPSEGANPSEGIDQIIDFSSQKLRQDTRIATFSLTGWDTHRAQADGMKRPLARLSRVFIRFKEQLGPEVWGKTTILAMTEFGRTAAENGSAGTDHGTAGVMLAAGGAVRGGQILGQWPGLEEAALYQRRDLMATSDVRGWAAHVMQSLFSLDQTLLSTQVFPKLDMSGHRNLIL